MKKKNSFRRKGLLFACAWIVSMSMFSRHSAFGAKISGEADSSAGTEQQQADRISLSGTVTDDQGVPLPGVNIYLKSDKKVGTVTDADGKFAIAIQARSNDALVFTFIGMKNHEVPISREMSRTLAVVLQPSELQLGEVVITGIFNKPRESYTGAATMITSKELGEVGNRSVITSIRNIDPSFNIVQDLTIGSDPNALPSITMRGASTIPVDVRDLQEDTKNLGAANLPLIILDGFEISLARMMDMDENQIENITLLKDASATAMYGSRGSNGVVVITSKKPEAGKLRFTYRANMNIEAPDLSSYNLMNAREKLAFEKAAGLYSSNSAQTDMGLQALYNQRKMDAERGVDTYWLSYPVRVGAGQRHNLRIEGGDDNIRYAANLSYNNVMGAMKGSKRNTLNGGVFLSYRLKNITFQNDLQITSNNSTNSPYGSFDQYTKINSYWARDDEEGNLKKVLENFRYLNLSLNVGQQYVTNPLYNALLPQRNENSYQQIINNFAMDWHIIPQELFVRGRFNITSQNDRSDRYISAKDSQFDGYVGEDYVRKGRYTYGTGNSTSYEMDLTLNYSKTFVEKHQLFVGLGYNVSENKNENYSIIAEGFSNINMDFLGMANQYLKDGSPSGSEGISRRVAMVGTANYTYDHRYFIDLSSRLEGSSRFGGNKRFAPFWSSGIGWNLHQESFLKDNSFFNIARLKASYGISGSQGFSPYQAMTTFRDYSGSSYRGWYGVSLMGLGNKDLAWQQTGQFNVGTELELWRNRIRLNVDVYDKITDNLVTDVNLPSSSGFTAYKANVGKVSNKGVEVTLNAYLIRDRKRDISWSVGGSLMHNKNEVMEISNSLQTLNEQLSALSNINPSFLFQEGESMSTIYAVMSKGIDPSNGLEIFVKKDGTETYTWDAKDKVAVGVNEPKIQGNLNTLLRYKCITLNAIFGYRYGGQMYNYTLVGKVENILPYDNADKRAYYNRWKEPGDKVFFKSVKDFSTTNVTSRFVMDENTLDCRSLSLGYEVPRDWLAKNLFGVEYLSITGYAEDLFTISSIKLERGTTYPYARKFSAALTLRF